MWLQRRNVYDIILPSGTWNVSDVNAIICHSNYSPTNLFLHLTGRVIHCTSIHTAAQSLGKSGGNITCLECRPTYLDPHENILDRASIPARHTSSKPLMLAGLGVHNVAGTLCSLFTLFSYQSGAQMANNYFSVCSLLLGNYQHALRLV